MRKLVAAVVVVIASFGAVAPVSAHGGGLDKNGGHYCRDAGFRSGKCSPRNSYHCHKSHCRRR